jgi:hypothetical protein
VGANPRGRRPHEACPLAGQPGSRGSGTVGRAKPPARHFDVAQVLRGVPAVALSAGNGASSGAFDQRTRVRLLPALRFGAGANRPFPSGNLTKYFPLGRRMRADVHRLFFRSLAMRGFRSWNFMIFD